MIIDAHQHFWQVARGDYGWLTPDLTPLYRDFMPGDLAPMLAEHVIDGTILVQAAPTRAETDFLLQIADRTDFVKGVVGWVDFESSDAATQIATLAAHPKLVGLRPMIQDIADDAWMLRDDLSPAFAALCTEDLTFDALVKPRHLPHLLHLLARYPTLRVVIDHGAKPDIAANDFFDWADHMASLAHNTTAYCKLSGLVTEAAPDWSSDDLHPYIAHLIKVFGPDRLIWGSDWPVLTLAASYDAWVKIAQDRIPSASDKKRVFGLNACAAYRLDQL